MSASSPDITVIIPNWNGMRWLPGCMSSLKTQTYDQFKTIIVDNGSTDGSQEWLKTHHPDIEVFEHYQNTGFAHAVNTGIRAAGTPYIILLNNDTKPAPNWIHTLRDALLNAETSVAGVCGKMLQMENPSRIENAGDQLSWQGAAEKRGNGISASEFGERSHIFSCCAGGAIYRKSFFDDAGYFDDSFFAYLEDIDLGLRGGLFGYQFLYEPSAVLEHHSHGSELPSSRYVRLTTANRMRLLIKNIPASLLFRHMISILYGQWYFLVCNRKPFSSLLGYRDFFAGLPETLRQRKSIRQKTKLSNHDIERLLEKKMNQPGIIAALIRNVRTGGSPT